MTTIASTYPADWPAQNAHSLAGQSAFVIQCDGSRRAIRFGSDVHLHQMGAAPILQPVVEGHLDATAGPFRPEDRELVLCDGAVFRLFIAQSTFFFAIAPVTPRLRARVAAA
jgi:hypothetical protein